MSVEPGGGLLIVIPCLNEAGHIEALVDALLAAAADDALLVVADGGSTDGSPELVAQAAARDGRVRLLHNPARLQSAGVNAAVRRFGSGRRWLLRVDAHADYPCDYGARLLATAERTGADAVVTPMETRGRGCFQRAAATAQNSVLGAGGSPHRTPGVSGWVDHGHHALMRIDRFVAVGGYDEGFSHNEDAELDARLVQAGARIWLAGDAVVGYYPRSAPGPLWRQYLGYGGGRARNLARHRQRMKLRQLAPLAIAPSVALLALAPVWPWAALPAAAWALLCLGFGALQGVRRRDGCAAVSGAAAMIMHLAWSVGFWRERLRFRRAPRGSAPTGLVLEPPEG